MQIPSRRFFLLGLALIVTACAGTQTPTGKISDYTAVRVSGSVKRDFERSLDHLAEREYEFAIALLQSVVAREQRLPAPYINLGIAHYQMDNEKDAEDAFLRALELDENHPVATNELAVLYRRQGRFADARHLYVHALAENPEYLPLIKNLGILCDLYLQDLECALAQFQHYVQLEPQDQDVSIWLADLKRRASK
ncbi:tetratricopeptide repeat protein [Microbulbifer sp. 2205BS26-8]|uniref:tetratricopeptide repeat protein n=1 Tax=Microbulbifer sp. 2205BS26-8 TaxID=3064386 RepID=UPI00273FAD97|nr:tetratricopeptide repeat protein [Microbulbifer sp. 2205BS26-8]MDP5210660.1 tetratricopeptide repeat protein [Microbulbifer sp. 2205BS26-8]